MNETTNNEIHLYIIQFSTETIKFNFENTKSKLKKKFIGKIYIDGLMKNKKSSFNRSDKMRIGILFEEHNTRNQIKYKINWNEPLNPIQAEFAAVLIAIKLIPPKSEIKIYNDNSTVINNLYNILNINKLIKNRKKYRKIKKNYNNKFIAEIIV